MGGKKNKDKGKTQANLEQGEFYGNSSQNSPGYKLTQEKWSVLFVLIRKTEVGFVSLAPSVGTAS